MNIFIGYDKRQPLAYNVCRHSIERRASKRVHIEPLIIEQMPIQRKGLTEFTFSRYLVPYLCQYKEEALFLDPDMIVLEDIHKIKEFVFMDKAVSIVKNPLRFEWPSLMYFNNPLCGELTLEEVALGKPQTLAWAQDRIGALPSEWNHCVGYDAPNPNAKIVHFTQGIPCWPETQDCEFSKEWQKEAKLTIGTVSWNELMGQSVHKAQMNIA